MLEYLNTFLARMKPLWPYAVAVALPGGSLIAIAMWLYSRFRPPTPRS